MNPHSMEVQGLFVVFKVFLLFYRWISVLYQRYECSTPVNMLRIYCNTISLEILFIT